MASFFLLSLRRRSGSSFSGRASGGRRCLSLFGRIFAGGGNPARRRRRSRASKRSSSAARRAREAAAAAGVGDVEMEFGSGGSPGGFGGAETCFSRMDSVVYGGGIGVGGSGPANAQPQNGGGRGGGGGGAAPAPRSLRQQHSINSESSSKRLTMKTSQKELLLFPSSFEEEKAANTFYDNGHRLSIRILPFSFIYPSPPAGNQRPASVALTRMASVTAAGGGNAHVGGGNNDSWIPIDSGHRVQKHSLNKFRRVSHFWC